MLKLWAKITLGVAVFVGGALIIVGSVLGFKVLPDMVHDEIGEKVRLENGTEQYERWETIPFALSFKVYLFNVENPNDVMLGVKPIVKQIGPFAYKQLRKKVNIETNDGGKSLHYNQMQNYEFDPDNSGEGLTKDTEVTVFNVPLYGIFQNVEFGGSTNLDYANRVHELVFPGSKTMFLKVNAHDFLFGNAYEFCRSEDMVYPQPNFIIARAFCLILKQQIATNHIKTMEVLGTRVKFAFFRYKDNADDGRYNILSGLEGNGYNAKDTGTILSWENLEYLQVWNGQNSDCNMIQGTDGAIYPPYQDKDETLTVFSSDICRSVQLKFEKETDYKGIDGYQSRMMSDSFNNDGSKSCYCTGQTRNLQGENGVCLPNGFVDMVTCLKSQIVLSFPHLLYADSSYADTVTGLSPDPELHATYVELQPNTGSPLKGAKRVQFNMFMRPMASITKASLLPRAVMPILWIEEGTDLPDNLVQKLKDDLISKLNLVEGLKWGIFISGIVIFVISAGILIYKTCFDKVRTLR